MGRLGPNRQWPKPFERPEPTNLWCRQRQRGAGNDLPTPRWATLFAMHLSPVAAPGEPGAHPKPLRQRTIQASPPPTVPELE